jgi:hypothetical protein
MSEKIEVTISKETRRQLDALRERWGFDDDDGVIFFAVERCWGVEYTMSGLARSLNGENWEGDDASI